MRLLERPGALDDTLDPLSPPRLAFQVRQVLAERQTSLPAGLVYEGVVRRRKDLTEAAVDALETYRERAGDLTSHARRGRLIDAASGQVSAYGWLVLLGAVLGAVLPAAESRLGFVPRTGFSADDLLALGSALLAALVLLAAGRVIETSNADHTHLEEGEYRRIYDEVVQGRVATAVEDLVAEVIAEEEERARAPVLHPMAAPSLVELDPAVVIQAESHAEVRDLTDGHSTSAIGIAGSRGAGKSTLLRRLCSGDRRDTRRIGVYLPVPAAGGGGLARTIFAATVRTVIASRGVEVTRRRGTLRRRRIGDDIAWALEALDKITGSVSRQRSRRAGLSRWGVTAEAAGSSTWTERELGAADWAEEFRGYVRGHRLRGGAPILIAIDELDKASNAEQAIGVINELKDLFHIEGVHFVVSVSEDALHRFAARGVPVRDAFDTAFDAIVEVRPLTARESHELLRRRAPRFPLPAAMFCHAWSGGLPRDLVRTARACIAVQRRLGHPATVAELSAAVIRRDVTEVLDAAIRRAKDCRDPSASTPGAAGGAVAGSAADAQVEELLALRRRVADADVPPGTWLAPGAPIAEGGDPLLASMGAYLEVATAIGGHFGADSDAEDPLPERADLLAAAKAALAIHPNEARWRLSQATAFTK